MPYETLQGCVYIVIVAVIWVAASFLVQDIESAGLPPFLLTYVANSLFSLYVPVVLVLDTLKRGRRQRLPSDDDEALASDSSQDTKPTLGFSRQILKAALVVAPLWFAAQWTFNLSLTQTSVTSNTILSSTASVFTYAISIALLGEAVEVPKVAGIVACILGTALVTLADAQPREGASTNSVLGNGLVLLSGLCYASYTAAIRGLLPEDDSRQVMQLFGLVGLVNLCGLAPVLLLSQATGAIDVWAPTLRTYGWVVVKGLLDNVLSDYLWARAVLLMGPTLATVGLSIQVPLAVAADAVFKDPAWLHSWAVGLCTAAGALLVLAGFLGATLVTAPDAKAKVEPGPSTDRETLRMVTSEEE